MRLVFTGRRVMLPTACHAVLPCRSQAPRGWAPVSSASFFGPCHSVSWLVSFEARLPYVAQADLELGACISALVSLLLRLQAGATALGCLAFYGGCRSPRIRGGSKSLLHATPLLGGHTYEPQSRASHMGTQCRLTSSTATQTLCFWGIYYLT